ncbi:GNAT family N-acetyltransferase [Actinopolymorpha singaporensis]|uniref:Ribosomal protein S18 acetylase RimI n=1 Tax=Actinopolymorpha singaporensis TaxID=117157 RepID=A0A1H1Y365_9ACTN|nr:GNAT family N-acetyltransferase [Actinopolymorpha singaporensis]SDT15689.1 Ribosomal protein S18 acetylase RimI [Actinopolymorpha singaporensis]
MTADGMTRPDLPDLPVDTRVWAAHADAWQAMGRIRVAAGGGAARLPGCSVMASGLPHPQWNNGDVTDPALFDLEQVRAWYAPRGVPWGVRVPAGTPWRYGRWLFRKRCMTLAAPAYDPPAAPPPGVTITPAGPDEAELFATVDADAFGDPVEQNLAWVRPQLGADGFRSVLARLDGEPVGVATGIRTGGPGGESVGVFGVGVLPGVRRRGIGAALTADILTWGFGGGATLAHLNPETEEAARLYTRLGFTEVAGLDIYVALDG